MYFYHVDMARRLQTGMAIELSPQTLSVFGKNYWNKFLSVGIKSIPPLQGAVLKGNSLDIAAYREFWLEVFRTDHPELKELSLPSRLNSFFAVESVEDAYKYISRNPSCDNAPIFEIYSQDPGLKLDMTWLDQKFPKDFRQFGYYYLKYWKGERIENDPNLANHEKRGSLIEVLLGGSIEVGKVITKHSASIY